MPSPLSPFHLLLLFTLSATAWAQNITLGTLLSATETSNPWRSPSGDFAFGFRQLPNDPNLFLISIWFDNIPDKTIVWYQRTIDAVPRGSTLELNARDGLVLRDSQRRLIYSTSGLVDPVAYGFLNDTGNLLLLRADSSVLWESFRNPSDTMLPTQTIEINEALISRKSQFNFSQGRFSANMEDDGDFAFNTKTVPSNSNFDDEYYSSFTSDPANANNSGIRVVFSDRSSIYVLRRNGQTQPLTSSSIPPSSENYYRATLDFDGVFTLYYHPRNSGNDSRWQAAFSLPDNICKNINGRTGSGACGYNSVCSLPNGTRPICACPRGFSPNDPSNPYGDCKPNSVVQSCVEEDDYDMLEILDVDWPLNDYEQIMPSSEQDCRSACLNDCLCSVAVYRSGSCWKKRLPLSNGQVDSSLNVKAFLKFRKGDNPLVIPDVPTTLGKPGKDHKTLVIVLSVLSGSSVSIIIGGVLLVGFLIRSKKLPPIPILNSNLRCFSYKELVEATNGFKEEVGRGAFGIVYKGVIPAPNGSNTIVAVKKLHGVAQDSEKEFRTEVNAIGQTHHKNLVPLVGFCDEGPHRLLVYQYMSNGTLAGFLFDQDQRPTWNQRTQIAFGVARGLTYLHEECITQIIHCDIKPRNILLDEYHNARISDFGLAKLLVMNQSKTTTNIRGTKGYVAPEWFRNTQISTKVDVYSFGVVLLETITCRKSLEDLEFGDGDRDSPILTDWVWDCFSEGRLDKLVKMDEEGDGKMVERFVKVGIWCIQEDACLRPTMRRACQMLEGIVEVGVPPCPFAFTSVFRQD